MINVSICMCVWECVHTHTWWSGLIFECNESWGFCTKLTFIPTLFVVFELEQFIHFRRNHCETYISHFRVGLNCSIQPNQTTRYPNTEHILYTDTHTLFLFFSLLHFLHRFLLPCWCYYYHVVNTLALDRIYYWHDFASNMFSVRLKPLTLMWWICDRSITEWG